MTSPKLGLVTVLFNSPEILEDFFRSLSVQSYPNFVTYIVDNSTSPEPLRLSMLLAEQYQLNVVFIDNAGNNVGVAAGNNQGISAARTDGCEYIGLINNDLIFEQPNIFSIMVSSLTEYDMVTPKIMAYPSGDVWFEYGYFDLLKGSTPHSNLPLSVGQVPYAPTCFLFVRADVFHRVGLMDEWYFAYYDDSDFVFRAIKSGCFLGFITNVVIDHKVSSSTGGSYSDFSVYYGTRNRIYFIRKNLRRYVPLFFTIASRVIVLPRIKVKQYSRLFKAIVDGLSAKIK